MARRVSSTTSSCSREGDRRNVVDRYRYWSMEAIVADLDTRRHDFHVAIENWQHDFNIGTIVRSANAFLAREVHIVGRKRWNRRGAMVTDRYQHVRHHETVAALAAYLHEQGVSLMGVDNLPGSEHLETWEMPRSVCFLFGQEGPGLSDEARRALRRDVLDRAVRLDPVDQRLGGRRDRDARLDHPARRPRGGLARLSVGEWRRPRVAGSGRTGRRPPTPRGWAAASSRRRTRAAGGSVRGRRRCRRAASGRPCRPRGRPPRPGTRAAGRTRRPPRRRSGRSAARRARPARAAGVFAGSWTSFVAAAGDHVAAHPARAALELGLAGGEQRPGEDRGRAVGERAADEPLVGGLAEPLAQRPPLGQRCGRGDRLASGSPRAPPRWCARIRS